MQHQSELLRVCVKGSSGPPTAPGRSLRSAPGSGHGREADPWSLQTVLSVTCLCFTPSFEGEGGQHLHSSCTPRDCCFLLSFALYFSNTVGSCFSILTSIVANTVVL